MLRWPRRAFESIFAESFFARESFGRGVGGRAQAQRHDFQPRLAVGRAAPVELLVARIEALMQRSPERTADALLREHHLDLVDLALVAHVERELVVAPRRGDAVAVHLLARPFLQGLEGGVRPRRVERARLD